MDRTVWGGLLAAATLTAGGACRDATAPPPRAAAPAAPTPAAATSAWNGQRDGDDLDVGLELRPGRLYSHSRRDDEPGRGDQRQRDVYRRPGRGPQRRALGRGGQLHREC